MGNYKGSFRTTRVYYHTHCSMHIYCTVGVNMPKKSNYRWQVKSIYDKLMKSGNIISVAMFFFFILLIHLGMHYTCTCFFVLDCKIRFYDFLFLNFHFLSLFVFETAKGRGTTENTWPAYTQEQAASLLKQ